LIKRPPDSTAGGRDEMASQVTRTLQGGGELLAGGGPPDDADLADGFFYEPTVVADPRHDAPMATEEVFGPALPIWRVKDLDEAIEWAKRCPNPPGEDWELEIRPVFEAEDFGDEFTPELREQEELVLKKAEANKKKPR